jgi:hypothetical protein
MHKKAAVRQEKPKKTRSSASLAPFMIGSGSGPWLGARERISGGINGDDGYWNRAEGAMAVYLVTVQFFDLLSEKAEMAWPKLERPETD